MRVAPRSLSLKRRWAVRSPSGRRPHVCVLCGRDHVHPVDWDASDDEAVRVRLRCGSCGTWREDTFDADTLERFDRKLSEDEGQMAALADRLHREWRMAEVDAFADALDRDLIDASDFAG